MNAYKPKRMNESTAAPYRTDRFYCIKHEWYFAIRRGPDQGPYPSKAAAHDALKKFITEELQQERHRQAERQLQDAMLKPSYRS
jgi:hypothetical protein